MVRAGKKTRASPVMCFEQHFSVGCFRDVVIVVLFHYEKHSFFEATQVSCCKDSELVRPSNVVPRIFKRRETPLDKVTSKVFW